MMRRKKKTKTVEQVEAFSTPQEEVQTGPVDIGATMVENADAPSSTPEQIRDIENEQNESTQTESVEQATERVAGRLLRETYAR